MDDSDNKIDVSKRDLIVKKGNGLEATELISCNRLIPFLS